MLVGDLDGRNSVYRLTVQVSKARQIAEFSGSIVLRRKETVLAFKTEFRPSIRRVSPAEDEFKGVLFPSTDGLLRRFYPGDGWGTLYLTNERILFLRRPDVDELAEVHRDYQSADRIHNSAWGRAMSVIREGGMEFLEITYEDVTGYERGLGHVKVIFRTVDEERCEILLPRRQFDVIEPILEAKKIQGTRKAFIRADVPASRLFLALIETASILAWLFADSPAYGLISLTAAVIVPMVALIRETEVPRISSVKSRKWGEAGRARTRMIVVGALSGGTFALGASVLLLLESVALCVFFLVPGGIFAIITFLFSKDWKNAAGSEQASGFNYDCPNCGKNITRRDIACTSCGSCVWWIAEDSSIGRRRNALERFQRLWPLRRRTVRMKKTPE